MANRRFTKEQMEFMLKQYGSDAGIARHLGVSRQSVQKQRTLLGVQSRLSKVLERNKKILHLHSKGWTVQQLMDKTNLSLTHIKRIITEGTINHETNKDSGGIGSAF